MKTCIKRRGRIKNWFWAFKIKFDALFQCRKIGRPSSVNRHSTLLVKLKYGTGNRV